MAIDGGIFNPSQKSHRTRQSDPSAKKNKTKKNTTIVPNDKTHIVFYLIVLNLLIRHLCLPQLSKLGDYNLALPRKSNETFEFLNIMQNHGFPKVMGVLTDLDKFKDVKKLRKTKQRLKHRFWTKIYDGAKLFYLSGLIHGKYAKREVHNLARFISVMKFHPLSWQKDHPYVLVDRFEDVTPPGKVELNNKCNRNVTLYGYLRGCNLKKETKVHIAGVGDFSVAGITSLTDPCPLPSAAKKKGLRDKERLFYAPMSGLGDLLYEKDAVYININDHFVQFSKVDGESGEVSGKGKERDIGEKLVESLQNTKYSIDEKLEKSFNTLFSKNPSGSVLEEPSNTKDNQETVGHTDNLAIVDQYQAGGESETDEPDDDDEDGDVRCLKTVDSGSDEGNLNALEDSLPENKESEHVEFRNGRMRRKAVFGNELDLGDEGPC